MIRSGSQKSRYKLRPSVIRRLFTRFGVHLRKHRGKLAVSALCVVGAAAMEILRPWPIKVIFDGILIPGDNPGAIVTTLLSWTGGGDALLATAALSVLVFAVVGGLFAFGQAYLLASVGQKVVASIRYELYSHVQRLSQSFHDTASSGDLLARLTGDVRMMRDLLVTAFIYISARSLVLLGSLVVMTIMDWRLTLIAVSILPVLAVVVLGFGRKIKGAARRQRRKESKIAHIIAEKISSIRVVQAYSREAYEESLFARQNNSSAKAGLVATRLEAHLDRVVQITLAVGTCGVIWYGVSRVQAGILTPGDLLVFVAYLTGLYKPVRKIASLTGRISKATVCGERILAILDLEPEIADAPDAYNAQVFKGHVSFENVRFAYETGDDVLTGASLEIQPGEKIAFTSRSGSGKSTVAYLIMRLYDVQEGAVKIDHRDVREYTLTSLRDQIALLLQETILFNTSIRENIAYGKLDATDEEIVAAATAANAHDFITRMPDGYDSVIGERGATLSGGQRQRIAIARAIVRDAPIIILDEPLTGLDEENEIAVLRGLERLIAGKTCLIVTHAPEATRLADRVIAVEDGTFVTIDTAGQEFGKTRPVRAAKLKLVKE